MQWSSITGKLLAPVIGAFILTTVAALLTANSQFNKVIDSSQQAVYEEKVESICALLRRTNERLLKTGLVEAYQDDFKNAAIATLHKNSLQRKEQRIYPFILDLKGTVILHPHLSRGDRSLAHTDLAHTLLAAPQGSLNYTYQGEERWCFFKQFPAWNWVVAYTLPLEIKYQAVKQFRTLLIIIMGVITCLALAWITLMIGALTRPIIRLSQLSRAIANGNLDQNIPMGGNDEIGILSRNFIRMRDAIRKKIRELEEELKERQKAEQHLLQKNAYIHSILESLTHPFYAVDINDYTIKIANSASGFHYTDSTACCYQLTHNRDRPCHSAKHPCPLEIIKRTKKPVMVEHTHQKKDGTKQYLEIHAYPVFDQQGELIQMIEYAIDVTEHRVEQAELATEKERLAVTLRSIGDGVITTDISGNVLLLNKVAEQITGWRTDKAQGRPLGEVFTIIDEETREPRESPVVQVVSSGQVVSLANHTILMTKDGRERYVADSGAPIMDAESTIIGVVVVFRDVTEQLTMEQELLKVKKLESIGVLAGGIAHDFNNILAAILGNINLALFDPELNDKTKKLLSSAEKASLRAKELTQQLLTFSKGGEPIKEVTSLETIIKDSAEFILHGKNISCHYALPDDLWLVNVDTGQISQVIQNIVLNAAHAMPEGGLLTICGENYISSSEEGFPLAPGKHFVKVAITDKGRGIPAHIVENIFDPYFTTKEDGSGLGLAISQSIIKRHHGHITVESTMGEGTTFTLYLLATTRQETTDKKTAKEEKKTESASGSSGGLKILLMDDEEAVRNVSGEMLTMLGNEVVFSENGEEAVACYKTAMDAGTPFHLVIMDLTIPGGMGGAEAVQEILALDPQARVMVSSGYSNDPIMADCTAHGFCAALVKPYQLQQLAEALSRYGHATEGAPAA